MNWRALPWTCLFGLAIVLAGCGYGSKKPKFGKSLENISGPLPSLRPGSTTQAPVESTALEAPPSQTSSEEINRRDIILGNVVKLMQTAYNNPGGRNFEIATEHLNELFDTGFSPADFKMTPKTEDFLLQKVYELTGQDPTSVVKQFSSTKFTIRDARHIEDCMLYHAVAVKVAGEGDDLTRVRRIFDWVIRNILLVPPESLSGQGLRQAQARPADVLFRGMAVEVPGSLWAERGWLFMALCRQIGVDVGLLTYTPRRPMAATPVDSSKGQPLMTWICTAIVDKKAYLFDARIGLEIPSLDGTGVATLEEAIRYPEILDRLDLPGQFTYGTRSSDLANSPTKIGVLLDSSRGQLSPRMRLLQGQLRGQNRTVLFRDSFEQASAFAEALGPRLGRISLWSLPIFVEDSLFGDNKFVQSTIMSLTFFDNKLPLVFARTAQLRGDLTEAINKYVALRFAENAVMNGSKDDPIPPQIQHVLDVYATYFLALAHYDQGHVDQAEYLFTKTLELVPEPGPGRYFYYFLRCGAQSNLGRICEAKGDAAGAIAYYSKMDMTTQLHGNLLRARNLAWKDPFGEPARTLPPAPLPETAAPKP